MADQPSKPRTIPQLKRSLKLAHLALDKAVEFDGFLAVNRAKQRVRNCEEALRVAEYATEAAQGHRLTSDQALARLAEPEHNPSRCQCADPRCPVHAAAPCPHRAETVVRRVDMDDQTGTPMCEGCTNDALDSGLFDVVEDLPEQEAEPTPRPSLDLLLRFVADAGRHSYFVDGEEITQAEVEQMQQWLEAAARQGVDRA